MVIIQIGLFPHGIQFSLSCFSFVTADEAIMQTWIEVAIITGSVDEDWFHWFATLDAACIGVWKNAILSENRAVRTAARHLRRKWTHGDSPWTSRGGKMSIDSFLFFERFFHYSFCWGSVHGSTKLDQESPPHQSCSGGEPTMSLVMAFPLSFFSSLHWTCHLCLPERAGVERRGDGVMIYSSDYRVSQFQVFLKLHQATSSTVDR